MLIFSAAAVERPRNLSEKCPPDGILKKSAGKRGGEQRTEEHVVRHGFLYDENGNRKEKKLIAVELAPPFDADDEKLLESAHLLKNAGVDVLTFPDSRLDGQESILSSWRARSARRRD